MEEQIIPQENLPIYLQKYTVTILKSPPLPQSVLVDCKDYQNGDFEDFGCTLTNSQENPSISSQENVVNAADCNNTIIGSSLYSTVALFPTNKKNARVWEYNLTGYLEPNVKQYYIVYDFSNVDYKARINFKREITGTLNICGHVLDAAKFVSIKYCEYDSTVRFKIDARKWNFLLKKKTFFSLVLIVNDTVCYPNQTSATVDPIPLDYYTSSSLKLTDSNYSTFFDTNNPSNCNPSDISDVPYVYQYVAPQNSLGLLYNYIPNTSFKINGLIGESIMIMGAGNIYGPYCYIQAGCAEGDGDGESKTYKYSFGTEAGSTNNGEVDFSRGGNLFASNCSGSSCGSYPNSPTNDSSCFDIDYYISSTSADDSNNDSNQYAWEYTAPDSNSGSENPCGYLYVTMIPSGGTINFNVQSLAGQWLNVAFGEFVQNNKNSQINVYPGCANNCYNGGSVNFKAGDYIHGQNGSGNFVI